MIDRRTSILRFIVGVSLFFGAGAKAELTYHRDQKLSVLSIGLGTQLVNSTAATFQTFSLYANYRRALRDTPFSYSAQVSPIFQTSSLFGIQLSGSFAYQVVGSTEIATEYFDSGDRILSQSTSDTKLKVFTGLGATLLPVFGSNSTASYTGIFGEVSALYLPKNIGATLQCNKLSLGSKNLTMIGIFVHYFWSIH